jgi:hypothetical protein
MSVSPLRIHVPEPTTVPPRPAKTLAAPNELNIEPRAWWTLADTQVDALIIGDGTAVSRVLVFLWPMLRKPIFWCESRHLSLPPRCESTLVLESADALDVDGQRRLLEWLDDGAKSLRLIATSPRQLDPLVEKGKFSRDLYERLAAVKLVIG